MKTNEIIILIAEIIGISLGILIIYQILRKILGGSWSAEDIILTIVAINATATFAIFALLIKAIKDIAKLSSDHKNLSRQFYTLASDFKIHLREHKKL